jgi:DNA invertase Pin-like site-specific DNA recombinase
MAQYERRLIGQRTRDALAAKRAEGVRLGRPRQLPDAVVARIVARRGEGVSMSAIARELNADDVPTAQGGAMWRQSSIAAVLRSAEREPVAG